jgi:hypothetical protein
LPASGDSLNQPALPPPQTLTLYVPAACIQMLLLLCTR